MSRCRCVHPHWTLHWKMPSVDTRKSPENIAYDAIILHWKKNALCLSNIVGCNNGLGARERERARTILIFQQARGKCTALFNYLDYNAAPRFADCAEVKVPSRSFNELGPLILVPKFLIIFPLLKAMYLWKKMLYIFICSSLS